MVVFVGFPARRNTWMGDMKNVQPKSRSVDSSSNKQEQAGRTATRDAWNNEPLPESDAATEHGREIYEEATASNEEPCKTIRDDNSAAEPVEIMVPEAWYYVESWIEHPSHPISQCCEECKTRLKLMERAAFALGYQSIFSFFEEFQLLEMETYLQGEDRETMKLPKPDTSNKQQEVKNSSAPIQFLKVEHLTHDPREAEILDTRINPQGNFGAEINVKVGFIGGRVFIWTLRPNNPNYETLVNKFGDDSEGWVGKHIMLGIDKDKFNEREFPHVTFPPAKAVKS